MRSAAPLILGALALAFGACATPARELVVLQTTDLHGFYTATDDSGALGGMRRLAHVVDEERASGHDVLLVDSGDMWSGTLLSDSSEGELGVQLFNALGYDAAALGNHEFDYGPVGTAREGGTDPFGALEARLAETDFPVLAANLIDRVTGRPPAWPHLQPSMMVQRGGFRIGLVGVITEDTPGITFPDVGQRLQFTDAAAAVAREALALRQQGAELVMVLAHLGGACQRFDAPDDVTSCEQDSAAFRMARVLPKGLVDVILAGHTHRQIAHRVAGIVVAQSGRYGQAISRLHITRDPEQRPHVEVAPPIPLDGPQTGATAARVDALLAPAEAQVAELRAEVLGSRILEPLGRDRYQSDALGSFVCDVLLHEVPTSEVCLVNSGGLRNDLPAGMVTYGQLYDALPFGNAVATMELPGSVLLELLRVGTAGGHGVMQVAGLQVTYDLSRDPCPTVDRDGDGDIDVDDRDRLVRVTLADGTPIDPERTYRIVTNSFIARGGDSLRPILMHVHPDRIVVPADGLSDRDTVARYLRRVRPRLNGADAPVLTGPRVQAVGQAREVECPAH
ncbi:MAG: bifunctional metallophosphatase/5'-nucleotidase [Deltaproteobacteria bacterium]|nr:bifunctional metallophosphatase/5'-nucleotidase [Deltaproteobacteria bacterium]